MKSVSHVIAGVGIFVFTAALAWFRIASTLHDVVVSLVLVVVGLGIVAAGFRLLERAQSR